jgi:hypothetical protein
VSEGNQHVEELNISQSKKSRSLTFRLDSKVIDELQTKADNMEILLNVIVNQVLE